jgi:hypothetical protein
MKDTWDNIDANDDVTQQEIDALFW